LLEKSGRLRTITAAIAVVVAGTLSLGLAPFIVGALVRNELTDAQAGLCFSAEMVGFIVSSFLVVSVLVKTSKRSIALAALIGVMVGNWLCLAASSFQGYACARFLAGLGGGLSTGSIGVLATGGRAERSFAVCNAASISVAAACGLAVPSLAEHVSKFAIFQLIGGLAMCALLTVQWMPSESIVAAAPAPRNRPKTHRWVAVSLGGLMSFFYFAPIAALWAYATELGTLHGADASSAATTVSGGLLIAGLGGCLAASFPFLCDKRYQVVAMASAGGAVLVELLVSVRGLSIYIGAIPAFVFLWFVAYPLMMAILSEIDPTGRLAMSGAIIQTAAFAVGPLLGGMLFDRHAYATFGAACSISFAFAFASAVAIRHTLLNRAQAQ
jgi:predicted MFS family arabinose efflux permease